MKRQTDNVRLSNRIYAIVTYPKPELVTGQTTTSKIKFRDNPAVVFFDHRPSTIDQHLTTMA